MTQTPPTLTPPDQEAKSRSSKAQSGGSQNSIDSILAKINQVIEDGEGVSYDYYARSANDENVFTLADAKAALQNWHTKTAYQEVLDVIDRIKKELANAQSSEINEDDTGMTYFYTVKDVEWALERITNQVKAKYGSV